MACPASERKRRVDAGAPAVLDGWVTPVRVGNVTRLDQEGAIEVTWLLAWMKRRTDRDVEHGIEVRLRHRRHAAVDADLHRRRLSRTDRREKIEPRLERRDVFQRSDKAILALIRGD